MPFVQTHVQRCHPRLDNLDLYMGFHSERKQRLRTFFTLANQSLSSKVVAVNECFRLDVRVTGRLNEWDHFRWTRTISLQQTIARMHFVRTSHADPVESMIRQSSILKSASIVCILSFCVECACRTLADCVYRVRERWFARVLKPLKCVRILQRCKNDVNDLHQGHCTYRNAVLSLFLKSHCEHRAYTTTATKQHKIVTHTNCQLSSCAYTML